MIRRLLALIVIAGLAAGPAHAQGARIVEWVENAPASDPNTIALGYPVPIPVDTPLPFAGFRSYSGLHMRHQDLQASTPWVRGEVVGQTRRGRPIWAYRLGDANDTRVYGGAEQAMLTNGGIHAREWQSPEVATGIIELIATAPDDNHLITYLRENANVIVIPVNNVDGFLQTQRFPATNWLGTDPDYPDTSPRDGRMRRKNMTGADENLNTQADHRGGIDLNRNNNPFWATSTGSSSNPNSLVYHGTGPASEPETQALQAAAQLGPAGQLSMYTDMHSFSQVHLWSRSGNNRLSPLTERLLRNLSNFHVEYPAGKRYRYNLAVNLPVNLGIGTTAEYFTHAHQVPSWTLEIEPEFSGTDYGGLGRNGHDGFILPEAEVPRVRTQLAETLAVGYYQQAGPPAMTAARIVDDQTGAVVLDIAWEPASDTTRDLYSWQAQPLELDREYTLWVAYDKPMRWRTNGAVVPLPGQGASTLNVTAAARVDENDLGLETFDVAWLGEPDDAALGYRRYRDDAFALPFRIPAGGGNGALVDGEVTATILAGADDMSGFLSDANPATIVRWANGGWAGYEDDEGQDLTDDGGPAPVSFQLTSEDLPEPFVLQGGTSAAWYDPARSGEGFVLEALPDGRVVMYWFTYDDEGEQDWYIAVGGIRGNQALFPELLQVSGGVFGPDFDPAAITEAVVGSATFTWSDCNTGVMQWSVGTQTGRMDLLRLSSLMGAECGDVIAPPLLDDARLSGSWYDPTHSGEGYTLEVLEDQRLLVYWFGFGPDGARRWFFGIGEIVGDVFEFTEMLTTTGGEFGAGFDPADVEVLPWGSLELELNCEGGEARFTPTEPGFPPGTLDLTRLTSLMGLEC